MNKKKTKLNKSTKKIESDINIPLITLVCKDCGTVNKIVGWVYAHEDLSRVYNPQMVVICEACSAREE